jgi:hypothetical protein
LLRRIFKDESAKASFAVAGVVIMMLGSVSAMYLAVVNNDYRNSQMENKDIRSYNAAIDKTHIQVQTKAYYVALDTIWIWGQFGIISGDINSVLGDRFTEYIERNFPISDDLDELEVENYHVEIVLRQKNLMDYVRNNDVFTEDYGGEIDELNMMITEEYGVATVEPYYAVVGYVNYTIKSRSTEQQLNKNLTIDRTIKSLNPFLEDKLRIFEDNLNGESTDVARMTKYILTTQAQHRVREGIGSIGPGPLLTEDDIEEAFNLAIILEEIRRFRTVDPYTFKVFDMIKINGGGGGFSNIHIEDYLTRDYGTPDFIDPAAVYAAFNGFEPSFDHIFQGDTLNGSNVSNTQFQLGFPYKKPFEFFDESIFGEDGPRAFNYESIDIDQKPNYYNATETATFDEWVSASVSIGDANPYNDMFIYKSEPRGVHYIESLGSNDKPYETQWEISIKSKISLGLSTERRVFLRTGTHFGISLNKIFEISIHFPVSVFSDTGINNVVYTESDDFSNSERTYLNNIWDAALPMIKWGIDYHQKVLELNIEQEPIMSDKINKSTDIIETALFRAKSFGLIQTIQGNIFDGVIGPFWAYGYEITITEYGRKNWINVSQYHGSFTFSLYITSLAASYKGTIYYGVPPITTDVRQNFFIIGGGG